MTEQDRQPGIHSFRVLIIGLIAVIVVLGLALVIQAIGRSAVPAEERRIDALANSLDECVDCHRDETPGIVQQFGHSTMAAAEVTCRDCHEVSLDYPGAEEHEGAYILAEATTGFKVSLNTS